jgi:thioredoxin 1
MPMNTTYASVEPTRTEVDALEGPALLEFSVPWCPHCQAAQPKIASALASAPEVRHLKVEDGKGRPLGRSFQVKLWPTLVFLKDGREVARLVRPPTSAEISSALARIASGGSHKE